MPICGNYGWGVCGRYLVRELNKLCNVQLMTGEFDPADVGDEDSYKELKSLCVGDLGQSGPGDGAPVAVLQAIRGPDLKPWHVRAQGDMNIGYTFFEKNNLSHEDVDWAKENYEIIVAGSAWCENVPHPGTFRAGRSIFR